MFPVSFHSSRAFAKTERVGVRAIATIGLSKKEAEGIIEGTRRLNILTFRNAVASESGIGIGFRNSHERQGVGSIKLANSLDVSAPKGVGCSGSKSPSKAIISNSAGARQMLEHENPIFLGDFSSRDMVSNLTFQTTVSIQDFRAEVLRQPVAERIEYTSAYVDPPKMMLTK
ncbi:hypothetical protein SDC9_171193 [bioreactor metagenome]|uniref:Uncharacterized protein n=1 Tax=bioreactor metagenome TaxID=1076179 RepID=A0A645GCJ6_9ZZZZ